MTVGLGFDTHPLVAGRRLILGGVEIPFDKGLEGHSDADALAHAVIDALLGAACAGDIGSCFGTNDPRYKDVSSLLLLREAFQRVKALGYLVNHIDATIIAEAPRLASFITQMRVNLAVSVDAPVERVSVKATTANRVGTLGAGEGIAALAVASLQRLE
ncbi:MAG: 2-C-methyl-D-erythritol 2,4-cyclodiphosphate synthase [Candidatus Methylomirabilota bacterium]|nr:2-C-methyl-D-erythritol 2,4-cyclodiphosphate synthase [candidate division NC10 bacterium]PWB46634.1 MAG: 2-C-methyl-D-erythritol 2,4-cyclodiphosphate synthase [candidate division NC10 bacterium]